MSQSGGVLRKLVQFKRLKYGGLGAKAPAAELLWQALVDLTFNRIYWRAAFNVCWAAICPRAVVCPSVC